MTAAQQKTVLFFPLNSPGHINSSLGIADRLKREHAYRTVFLVLGDKLGDCIERHGHELVQIREKQPYEDYECESDDETFPNVDALFEHRRKEGKQKKQFPGVLKWPQLLRRYQKPMDMEPLEAFLASIPVLDKIMVGELLDNHDAYERAIKQIAPDLIVIDAYYIPPCIVKCATPWVRLYSANPLMIARSKLDQGLKPPPATGYALRTKPERELMRSQRPDEWRAILDDWASAQRRMAAAMSDADTPLKQFFERQQCPPIEPGQQAHDSPHLNLYMFPRELDYDQDDDLFYYPSRWFRCDSLMRQSLDNVHPKRAELWAERIAKASRLKQDICYFSLGSLASGNVKLMRRIIDMLQHDKKRLYIVSKGVNGDQYKLADNMIGENYLPQTFVLQRVTLAIVHGGNNSITECIYFGLPMIVLPVFADQLDNAQRVADLGLGARLDVRRCNAEQLIGTVNSVLGDKRIAERCRDIGKAMRAREDSRKISHMLVKLMRDNKLDQEFIDECREKDFDELGFGSAKAQN